MNQGLFKKLFIGQDGDVEDGELQDIFAGLFLRDETAERSNWNISVMPVPLQQGETLLAATGTDGFPLNAMEWGTRPERRWSPSAVLLRFGTEHEEPRPSFRMGGVRTNYIWR